MLVLASTCTLLGLWSIIPLPPPLASPCQAKAAEFKAAARQARMDELDDMADDDAILDATVRDENELEYAEGMAALNLPLDLHADRHAMYAPLCKGFSSSVQVYGSG